MAPEMSNPELLTSRAFPRWIPIFGQCRHDEQEKPLLYSAPAPSWRESLASD
jgi:hypothetical protein